MLKIINEKIEVCKVCTRVARTDGTWIRRKELDYHEQRLYMKAKWNKGINEVVCGCCVPKKTVRLTTHQISQRINRL